MNINSITASFASFTSASIGSLRTVTGSAVIIGDEFIILNADTPTARYAGLVVYDSGSGTPATASFEWDGLSDNWIIVEESGNSGVVLTGPTGSKGSEVEPTVNTLQKGGGHHTLIDSSITDDGTTTSVSSRFETANANASGINSTATGNGTIASGNQASVIGGFSNNASGIQAFIAGGGLSSVTQQRGAVIGGYQHIVGAEDSVIIGGFNSDVLATHARSVVLGGTALATSKADEVVVPHLTISGSTIATDISASGYISASEFIGDGSGLTGVGAFPYTGSAEITGSLGVTGSFAAGGADHTVTGTQAAAVGGDQTNASGERAVGIGGFQNTVSGTDSIVLGGFGMTASGLRSIVAGGIGNNATNIYSATLGGSSNNSEAIRGTIVGGDQCTIGNGANDATILGGVTHTIDADGINSAIMGGGNHTLNHSGSAIIGGTGITSDAHHTVFVPNLHLTGSTGGTLTFSDGTTQTTAAGGAAFPYTGSAQITGSLGVTGSIESIGKVTIGDALNVNSGTDAMLISIDSNTTATRAGVFAGYQNTASDTDSVVLGGFGNTASGLRGGVLAGQSNTASHIRSVVLGGISLSTTKADEVVVPNLDINGTVVQSVQALTITSNTASLDASTGQMFTLGLQNAADTHLELSNQVAGQTFSLKITNNATAAGTISFDSQFDFEDGTAFTATAATNAVDILTFTTFDGTNVQCVGSKNFS